MRMCNLKHDQINRRYRRPVWCPAAAAVLMTAMLVMTGCGSERSSHADISSNKLMAEVPAMRNEDTADVNGAYTDEAFSMDTESRAEGTDLDPGAAQDRKLIRNVELSFETDNFDAFNQELQNKTRAVGGYIESSDITGKKGDNYSNRHSYFVLRIPKGRLDEFLVFAEGSGSLTRKYENTQDITLQYYDTESRKEALKTEYQRLLELVKDADSVETIIALETRLSEIRYELDSFESTLRSYDNRVDYSTVTVNTEEKKVLTPAHQATFLDKVISGMQDNVLDLIDAVFGLLIWFLSSLPTILVVLLVIWIIVKLIRRHDRRYREKMALKAAELKAAEQKAAEAKTAGETAGASGSAEEKKA